MEGGGFYEKNIYKIFRSLVLYMLVVCVHQKIRFIRKSSNKYLEAGKN
jgi:hypothetical protein